jgi:hypothetical protein
MENSALLTDALSAISQWETWLLLIAALGAASIATAFVRVVIRGGLVPLTEKALRAIAEVAGSLIGVSVGAPTTVASDVPRLADLLEKLERNAASHTSISTEAEQKIVSLFEQAVAAGFDDQLRAAIKALVERQVHEGIRTHALKSLEDVGEKLQQASKTASIRGFFNLAIGIGFAVAALLILKGAVELFSPSDLEKLSISQTLYMTAVRISLALVITLIAYFFLALDKKSLDDVRYYQNEMTAIGVSSASLSVAYDCSSDDARRMIAEAILLRDGTSQDREYSPDSQASALATLAGKLIDKLPTVK